MRGTERRRLPRFASRRRARPRLMAARVLEVLHKLLTGAAALAALLRALF